MMNDNLVSDFKEQALVIEDISGIRSNVLHMLKNGLASSLSYHNVEHTIDVAAQCMRIAGDEGITDPKILLELEIAALYHDTGFLYTNQGHEEKSCSIAMELLPGYGIDNISLSTICKIIMATKMPQSPNNIIQEIICDADLDYLGREDYFKINEGLYKELLSQGFITSWKAWEQNRMAFLKSHTYFTQSAGKRRNFQKLINLQQLEENSEC